MKLFTQNSDLKKSGIYGWTLPAHMVTLPDGTRFNTCPNAGVCGAFCYAKTGTYMFRNVKKAHMQKLDLVLNRRKEWLSLMTEELSKKKYWGKFIRIHDAGDFFDIHYAIDWLKMAASFPAIQFYAYTKEVHMFKYDLADLIPGNFTLIYSFGGKLDFLIDKQRDRHSDVFPTLESMLQAGYTDIADDDSLAATCPSGKVGLLRNNIPHLIKKQGNKTFSEWQPIPKSEKRLS
jgi:hypothetical protein